MPRTADELASSARPTKSEARSDQAAAFLRRLRRLLMLRYQVAQCMSRSDVRLVDRCIYATYCDCVDTGAEAMARSLLAEARNHTLPHS